MKKALKLASRGTNLVSPNPRVGCIIARDGKIAGSGYHRICGGSHAEAEALQKAGSRARSGTVYVTLEPCSRHGRTPPCAPLLKKAGVKRVVIGAFDPTLKKSGVAYLKDNGIEVKTGVLRRESEELIENFTCFHRKKRPFVTLKCAMSLDGKIATVTGNSRWISSPPVRKWAMKMRGNSDAVLIGATTAVSDNPLLSYRLKEPPAKHPLRVIIDGRLSMSDNLKVVSEGSLIFTASGSPPAKKKKFEKKGAEIKELSVENGYIKAKEILKELYRRRITSVLIEGGGETVWHFIKAGIVDKIIFIYGSVIIGGRDAPSACAGEGFKTLEKAVRLKNMETFWLGKNFIVTGRLR